jgi:hypothetical protein
MNSLAAAHPFTLGQMGEQYNYFTGVNITFRCANPILTFGIDVSTDAPTAGFFQATTNLGVALSGFDPIFCYDPGQFAGFTADVGISPVTITLTDPDRHPHPYTLDTLRYQPGGVYPCPLHAAAGDRARGPGGPALKKEESELGLTPG